MTTAATQMSAHLAQALGHARLPAGTRRAPALDDVGREAYRDQLARVRGHGATALLDDGARQVGALDLGDLLVLVQANRMGVYLAEVRLRSTARDGLSHACWPFAC